MHNVVYSNTITFQRSIYGIIELSINVATHTKIDRFGGFELRGQLLFFFVTFSGFLAGIKEEFFFHSHDKSGGMAEIGIAASIISVAAFGVSVATTLYETADIMKNANPQISALAKHVTQFTAVLNHMGQMLETERINCSKEVLRDIKKIKRSCKRTFREIKATVKAQRFRRLMWLFKRTKAMELEARLDSQQSMLQCMIHTLTVSKLSRMDSRYAQAWI